ncbi:MAG: mannonate dehydratase, partial [Planctomycetes bacterium]|nr:mannonate dehydratase [Planctomycetota bacterium]
VDRSRIDEYDPANTKVGLIVPETVRDDDILFLQQIGLRSILVNFKPGESRLDDMRRLQERFSRHNIQIFGGLNHIYRSLKIQLGQPGRDEDIEQYRTFLRNLGRLGIGVAHYDFHPANTYTTAIVQNRGYTVREFSLEDFRANVEKQAFDREYSAEEIWANYSYFMQAVLPAAEEANVTLTLHPDDPPLAKMNGVAKLFTHYDGYHRAEELAAGSRHWGLTFCVGTWSEGGDRMGKDVFEMIRDFGGRGKIHVVHFRNVSSPLPRFHETFPDDGYLDMYRVMKSLREVGFSGCAVPDHIPKLTGDDGQRAGLAYCIASMRTLRRRANEEVG